MSIFRGLKSLLGSSRLDVQERFELLQAAVSGSMSKFYKARDRKTGQIVGLKVLDQEKTEYFESRFPGMQKPSEGEIALQFDHPNIVKTFEQGLTTKGEAYLVMEYLEGVGMNSLIIARDKRLQGRRLKLVTQAAQALGHIHEAGFIHRDICPRNFMISSDFTTLKLIDFGLTVPATPDFMQPGNRTGTPNYMAPEIVRRRKTDLRVDIFALGVTIYALCAFELPWSGGTTGKAAMNHDTQPPVDIGEAAPEIHPRLAQAIMQAIASNPAERPASMGQFLRLLSKVESETKKSE